MTLINLSILFSRKHIHYILLLIAIFLNVFLKLLPYLLFNYEFLIGFDTGKYIYDLRYKISTSPRTLDLWVEPALSTTLVSLNSLIQIDPLLIYKFIVPIYISVFFTIFVYLYTKRITSSSSAGVFSSFILSTSTIFLNATFDSFYRQIYGTMIYLGFLYFLDKYYQTKDPQRSSIILLSILGSGIIISHRAITLLFVITLIIFAIMSYIKKLKVHLKHIFVIAILSIVISSAYWVLIAWTNLLILRDAIIATFQRNTGGERIIKNTSRSDNQIVGYLKNVYISFLPMLGMAYLSVKSRTTILLPLMVFMTFYIFLKAIFSNRFLFNLEIFFAIASGFTFFYLRKISNVYVFNFMIITVLLINFYYSLGISIDRSPYVPNKTRSIHWVERNIEKDNTIIFAPDALSTILTSLGYKTAIYEFPLKTGEKDSRFTNTEEFLINGHSNLSLINDNLNLNKQQNIYVIFNEWHVTQPLARIDKTIPVNKWDTSKFFEKAYEGDSYVYRVYKLKNIL